MNMEQQIYQDNIFNRLEAMESPSMEDFNFSLWNEQSDDELASLDQLKDDDIESLRSVGVNADNRSGSGVFLMRGRSRLALAPRFEGLEILPIGEALEKYPEIYRDYYFKAVNPDQDAFTRAAAETIPRGYFIRVKKNIRIDEPVEAGFLMPREKHSMVLHNIVVLEEGARLNLVTGCTAGRGLKSGLHIAVTEHFVARDAGLVNTMVHNWGDEYVVRPRGTTIVEQRGFYVENYYTGRPPKSIEMNPAIYLNGKGASAKNMAAVICLPETHCDIGGTIFLNGEDSGAELVARAVNYGGAVVQKGLLVGAAKDARAHVDCSGLMMSDSGSIEAEPCLKTMHPDVKMSHEAAIGRIDSGAVNYLMSKGLTEARAVSLIVRGFLNIGNEIKGISPALESTIANIAALSGH